MDGRVLVCILITFARGCEGVNGTCPAGKFQCHNNNCITLSYLCDGDNDCKDGSDENLCDPCPANYVQCPSGDSRPCVHNVNVCDGIIHCSDRSDESNCDPCPANFSRCTAGFRPCVSDNMVCDGIHDCYDDGSDESTCDTCKAEAFHCDKNRCIHSLDLCDSYPDCGDNTDETNCDMATNKYGVLKIREPVFKNKDVELSFQLAADFSPTQVGNISWLYTRSGVQNAIIISESERVSFSEFNATYSMLIKQAGDNDQGSYCVWLSAVSGYSLCVKLTLQDSLATSRVQNVMIVAIIAAAMVLLVATIAVMFVCIRKKRHRQEITQQEPSAEPAEPAEQAVLYEQLNREDMVHSSLYNELEIPIYANET